MLYIYIYIYIYTYIHIYILCIYVYIYIYIYKDFRDDISVCSDVDQDRGSAIRSMLSGRVDIYIYIYIYTLKASEGRSSNMFVCLKPSWALNVLWRVAYFIASRADPTGCRIRLQRWDAGSGRARHVFQMGPSTSRKTHLRPDGHARMAAPRLPAPGSLRGQVSRDRATASLQKLSRETRAQPPGDLDFETTFWIEHRQRSWDSMASIRSSANWNHESWSRASLAA